MLIPLLHQFIGWLPFWMFKPLLWRAPNIYHNRTWFQIIHKRISPVDASIIHKSHDIPWSIPVPHHILMNFRPISHHFSFWNLAPWLGTKGVGQPFAGTPGPRPYLGTTAAVHAIGVPQRAGLEVPLADGGSVWVWKWGVTTKLTF